MGKERFSILKSTLHRHFRTPHTNSINEFTKTPGISRVIISDSFNFAVKWITIDGYSTSGELLCIFTFCSRDMSISKAFKEWENIHLKLLETYGEQKISDIREQ